MLRLTTVVLAENESRGLKTTHLVAALTSSVRAVAPFRMAISSDDQSLNLKSTLKIETHIMFANPPAGFLVIIYPGSITTRTFGWHYEDTCSLKVHSCKSRLRHPFRNRSARFSVRLARPPDPRLHGTSSVPGATIRPVLLAHNATSG